MRTIEIREGELVAEMDDEAIYSVEAYIEALNNWVDVTALALKSKKIVSELWEEFENDKSLDRDRRDDQDYDLFKCQSLKELMEPVFSNGKYYGETEG